MTEDRAHEIALAMEPVLRDLRNGADAAVAVALSPHYGQREPNGLFYIAERLEEDAGRLDALWRKLCATTEGDCPRPPLKAIEE